MFSDKVQEYLQQSGWTPDRKIDVTPYEEALRKEGYEIFPALREFLSNFGGLKLEDSALYRDLDFNPIEASQDLCVEETYLYERLTQEPLTVFGFQDKRHEFLMMSPSGKIYFGIDKILFLGGNNYVEFLENAYLHIAPKRLDDTIQFYDWKHKMSLKPDYTEDDLEADLLTAINMCEKDMQKRQNGTGGEGEVEDYREILEDLHSCLNATRQNKLFFNPDIIWYWGDIDVYRFYWDLRSPSELTLKLGEIGINFQTLISKLEEERKSLFKRIKRLFRKNKKANKDK